MKHVKMLLYGEPGVGKSVFASKFPKPFFITTDGNYEWLEDFGADPKAHKQVESWEEAKELFNTDFDSYETVVVDLVEDLFKWDEYEFCVKNNLEHISDLGYGKGYDITRNGFFIELSKLINKPKNIILISHEVTTTSKDRRGVEHNFHRPSNRIPDKVLDMIEGRMRYVLRCYMKNEDVENADGTVTTSIKRYLSLVPKDDEYGIIRGVNTDAIPQEIPLDVPTFLKVIDDSPAELTSQPVTKPTIQPTTNTIEKQEEKVVAEKLVSAKVDKRKLESTIHQPDTTDKFVKKQAPVEEDDDEDDDGTSNFDNSDKKVDVKTELLNKIASIKEKLETASKPVETAKVEKVEQPAKEVEQPAKKVEQPVEQKPTETVAEKKNDEIKEVSNEDKIAAIKAKLAALKASKGE